MFWHHHCATTMLGAQPPLPVGLWPIGTSTSELEWALPIRAISDRLDQHTFGICNLVCGVPWVLLVGIPWGFMIFKIFRCVFFTVKHFFWHISGILGTIDVKWRGSASVGYWVYYVTLTFDLTHDLDLGFFKVKFRKPVFYELSVWLMWKWKGSELIKYRDNCMTLPFDHTYDLDLEVQVHSLKLPYLRNGMANWPGKKGMWVIHSWLWYWLRVTKVGWVDILDSDWGDFTRLHAIDISSWW